MKKQLIPGGILLLLLFLLCRCNDDVFIEELRPSATELELDGNGDTQTIRLHSSDWNITTVYQNPALSNPFPFSWKSFDREGNVMENSGNYKKRLEGLGKMVFYNSEGLELLRLERNKGKELTIVAVENPDNNPMELFVNLDNDDEVYNPEIISLKISPCERYEVTGFTFESTPTLFSDYTCHKSFTAMIDNSGSDTPVTHTLNPYNHESRKVTFYPDDWPAFLRVTNDRQPMVELPLHQDGKLIPSGESVNYDRGTVEIPLAYVKEEVEVTVPARTRQDIEVWLTDEIYETRYTLTARNPKSGRERTFTGSLESQTPYEYSLIRKKPFPTMDEAY